ncbi:MAG TPA: hypothetical protein VJM12_04110 [Pyrinomonadaceae bacterium]|nr:hypothetical protein [Pyrinomonadaceae bacterium]
MSAWPSSVSNDLREPWTSFVKAREHAGAGDRASSTNVLRQILKMPNLESRHYLQAWHFLKQMGQQPADGEGKRLYGVVVEVGTENGLDILAAYVDGTARYFNYTGAAIIWERPDRSLDTTIETLLVLGQRVANEIGPWDGDRPAAPASGDVRINLLVPSGLHFGQGRFEQLASDGMGGPLIAAATELMRALIAKSQSGGR